MCRAPCGNVNATLLASYFLDQRFAFPTTFDLSRYPSAIPQGIAIPRWAFFNITVSDGFLLSVDMFMLTLDAKSSVNQTYDETTTINIGRKFGLVRGSWEDVTVGQYHDHRQHEPHG